MSNQHGGAREGAGRQTNSKRHADKIEAAGDRMANAIKQVSESLIDLAVGRGYEEKWVPAGTLTRKGLLKRPPGVLDPRRGLVDPDGEPGEDTDGGYWLNAKGEPIVIDLAPLSRRRPQRAGPDRAAAVEARDPGDHRDQRSADGQGNPGRGAIGQRRRTDRDQFHDPVTSHRRARSMAEADDREAVEYAKCAADYAYFIDTFGVIDDAQGHGDGSGTMPFKLWPAQAWVAWLLMTVRLTIILKARQLGISWLCCGYALWHCLFGPGKLVLLYSQGELEAIELLRRVKVLYERLPDWFRSRLPPVVVDNTTIFGWANGSRIQSLPATKKAGRGNAASLVIVDEAAFLQWANALYTALKPTIAGGGQLIILSTANGIGNLFHRLWTKAAAGLNSFKTIFLPWWSHPGRDAAFYAAELADAPDPAMVQQEYPANANEAFVASGRVRFQTSWIAAQAKNVRPGLPKSQWPESLRGISGLTIYTLPAPPTTTRSADAKPRPPAVLFFPAGPGGQRPPEPKAKPHSLLLAADVAEGLEHRDYSAATLLDAVSWDELLDLHGHWEPDEFGSILHAIAEAYGAQIMVERNNHGHTTLAALKALGSRRVALGHDGKRGWLTNEKTKPQAVDALAVVLRDELATFHHQAALDEMQVYQILKDGSNGAPEGFHDDRVMCRAIGIVAIKMGLHAPRKIEVS